MLSGPASGRLVRSIVVDGVGVEELSLLGIQRGDRQSLRFFSQGDAAAPTRNALNQRLRLPSDQNPDTASLKAT